jgi:hypothetical protein
MTNTATPARTQVGITLSASSTAESAFQPLENFENEMVEGKLVVKICGNHFLLSALGTYSTHPNFTAYIHGM